MLEDIARNIVEPAGLVRRPGVWETVAADAAPAHRAGEPAPAAGEPATVDTALALVEAEISRLRGTVLAYGEALKEIEVYGVDPMARETAAAALRRTANLPRAAEPEPHLSNGTSHG